mgnify:CR=1 FL=1|jgi:hypothetical protein
MLPKRRPQAAAQLRERRDAAKRIDSIVLLTNIDCGVLL